MLKMKGKIDLNRLPMALAGILTSYVYSLHATVTSCSVFWILLNTFIQQYFQENKE